MGSRNKGIFPPDKCATRLRYTPTFENPYRTRAFEARGNFSAMRTKRKDADAVGQLGTQSPTESPTDVPEVFRPRSSDKKGGELDGLFDLDRFMKTPPLASRHEGGETFVYVISCPPKFLKIGMTWDVSARLAELQTANPHPLTLVKSYRYVSRMQAALVERAAHDFLSAYHHAGEWFVCPTETVIGLLCSLQQHVPVLAREHARVWAAYDDGYDVRYATDEEFRKIEDDRERRRARQSELRSYRKKMNFTA